MHIPLRLDVYAMTRSIAHVSHLVCVPIEVRVAHSVRLCFRLCASRRLLSQI